METSNISHHTSNIEFFLNKPSTFMKIAYTTSLLLAASASVANAIVTTSFSRKSTITSALLKSTVDLEVGGAAAPRNPAFVVGMSPQSRSDQMSKSTRLMALSTRLYNDKSEASDGQPKKKPNSM